MKRKSTIRKDKYFLTLLCVLVAISVNAELRTQAVERFNGTITFSGSALNNVKNGVCSLTDNHVTFKIDNVKKYTRDGSIIVFHDSLKAEKNLHYALPHSIEWLLKEGYTFGAIE